jgi:hypothetical protein
VDLRAGVVEAVKRKFVILQGLELRPLDHPARSQSLYRLRIPTDVACILCHVGAIIVFHKRNATSCTADIMAVR